MRVLQIGGLSLATLAFGLTPTYAADYYVSAQRGKGKQGTLEQPAKSLGNLVAKLEPGDTIHLAGGEYAGKSDSGHVEINVPVSIIGGYSDDFQSRDPWGAHRTVLIGANKSENYENAIRLRVNLDKFNRTNQLEFSRAGQVTQYDIVIDGVIIDNGGRNRYKSEQQNAILRKADPKSGANPTPDGPGLGIGGALYSSVTVQNCVVMNCAPTQGALTVTVAQGGSGLIRNNLVINNTGTGIYARTSFHPSEKKEVAAFLVEHNTVVFTEKYDAYGTVGGDAFAMDAATNVTARNNVFAFGDQYGVRNASKSAVKTLTLAQNLAYGNVQSDLLEFDTKLPVDTWEDDSDELSDDSEGNVGEAIQVPVSKAWLERYLARSIIDRNAVEADIQASKGWVNDVRSIFGLPLQAPDLKLDSEVWLPRMGLEEALAVGASSYHGTFGCQKP